MNDKTLALLNEVTNSLADDIEDFSCGELRQALYRAIAQREEAATRIEALEAVLRIEIWNGLKRNGMSDDAATALVKERMAALEGSGNG